MKYGAKNWGKIKLRNKNRTGVRKYEAKMGKKIGQKWGKKIGAKNWGKKNWAINSGKDIGV